MEKVIVKTRDELIEIINSAKPNADLNYLDVSNVTDMSGLFVNTSNVISMPFMFTNSKFNRDISNWDISKVKNMIDMFKGCSIKLLLIN